MTTSTLDTLTPALPSLPRGSRLSRAARWVVRGSADTAAWERPALLGLLALTAILYIWNLGASGWANSFYSAAAQAGSTDWTAFFYGSSDAANSITVDKPPASLWLMALSIKAFGLSSWSILLPEALMGVASVAVLFATVRRRFPAGTALLAGGILAITPVAALMFRFNNPDALLVLLLSLATYFTLRGVETGKLKWVLWAGTMIGFAFLTKQLQAFLILPVLAGVYLWAAPHKFAKRLWHSLAALGAVIVSAGWWVAIVTLVPSSLRPYIGGSQTNSFLELTFGYNGFGRLTGSETGSVTGGAGGAAGAGAGGGMWGATGITRLFDGENGGQITWLLPAALAGIVIAIVLMWRRPRTSASRALVVLLGGSLVVTALAFSFMAGIFHAYYTVALAPAIAGSVAIGAGMLWSRREHLWSRIAMAALVLGTGIWSFALLNETVDWLPWLQWVVLVLAIAGAGLLLLPKRGRGAAVAVASVALAATLLGPLAYTLQTVTTAHSGSIVTAGPTVASSSFGPGGGGGRPGAGGPGGAGQGGFGPQGGGTAGARPGAGGAGGLPGAQTGTQFGGQGGPQIGALRGGPGGAGGLLNAATVSTQLAATLSANASSYTWVAAAVGSQNAAGYQLATQHSVMPIGGFNGSDPSPTLQEFQTYVDEGKIHWFIAGGGTGPSNGGSSSSSAIASWVESTFTAQTVDGVTLYDLTTGAKAATS